MARAETNKTYSTFVGGLFTESSDLNFPENVALDLDNVDLFRKGNIRRRNAVDYENNYSLSTATFNGDGLSSIAVAEDTWENVDGDSSRNFAVLQFGSTLYFYDLSVTPLSDGVKGFTVDLTGFAAPNATNIGSAEVSMDSGRGALFVSSEKIDPFYITYDPDGDSITSTEIILSIRDFDGVEDSLDLEERPSSLSAEHEYNLRNQGWGTVNGNNTITSYFNSKGVYPSNTQIWFVGKDSQDDFNPGLLDKTDFGNTRAPRGHFILDPFYKDRSDVSGVAGLDVESESKRPTAVAFFAGRVWYGGNKGNVYYSQVLLDNFSNVGNCYQEADPTSEEQSDLVATDGGVVKIPEAGEIVAFFVLGDNLVVFARNGNWQIGGSEGAGFKATDFAVSRISDVGTLSRRTIVDTDNIPVWFGEDGIYTFESNQVSLKLGANNLSKRTIQTFYDEIPTLSKSRAKGIYDRGTRRVIWLYQSVFNSDNPYRYDKALILDTDLGVFWPYTFSFTETDSPYIAGVIDTDIFTEVTNEETVVVGSDVVQVGGEDVVTNVRVPSAGSSYIKYLAIKPDGTNSKFTFADINNDNFYDWETEDGTGVSYNSYLETGHEVFGDIMRFKQAIFVYCYFGRTETAFEASGDGYDFDKPSSCLMRAKWEWADNAASNRWSESKQVYRLRRLFTPDPGDLSYDSGFPVVVTRNKVRGKGRAIRLRFESEAGKDFNLLGFAVHGSGNTKP